MTDPVASDSRLSCLAPHAMMSLVEQLFLGVRDAGLSTVQILAELFHQACVQQYN
jgi:hypothetical protein